MIKHIVAALFFSFVGYAIIADLGKPEHHYHSPNFAAIAD